jgi:hypothetical protein
MKQNIKTTQKLRRFLKKYYFYSNSTLLLPFFFVSLSLVIFFQQFNVLSIRTYVLEKNIIEALVIYTLLIGGIIALFIWLRNIIKKRIAPLSLEGVEPFIIGKYDKEKIIRREDQQKRLKEFFNNTFNQKKYAFFVGKSGSGKSLLVGEYVFYEKNVTRFNATDYSIQNDLDEKLQTIIEKCKNENILRYIIIFDQFERALVNQKVFSYIIAFLKQSQKMAISVAFVCMNEDYVRILEKLQSELIPEIDKTNDHN